MADEANDERISFREVEDPLIILKPFAGLDDDGADNVERGRQRAEFRREHRPVEQRIGLRGPRDPLRPSGVVKMRVRIDDGDRGRSDGGGP